jgi:hypothetical protein
MKIEKTTAKRLYPESPEWFKKQLEEEFGESYFTQNFYENIKTFEDACSLLGIDPKSVFNEETDTLDEIAYKKLKIVVRAINTNSEGRTWEPDWSNSDQYKYYPLFRVLSSGFGFSRSDCAYHCTATAVGSHLCFETSEQCAYAATQFIDLYEQFLTIKKQ